MRLRPASTHSGHRHSWQQQAAGQPGTGSLTPAPCVYGGVPGGRAAAHSCRARLLARPGPGPVRPCDARLRKCVATSNYYQHSSKQEQQERSAPAPAALTRSGAARARRVSGRGLRAWAASRFPGTNERGGQRPASVTVMPPGDGGGEGSAT
jgi:hypothetical protein